MAVEKDKKITIEGNPVVERDKPLSTLKVSIELDLKHNQTKILGGMATAWATLGVLLEGIGVLVPECMTEKKKTKEEMVGYLCEYMHKLAEAYETPVHTVIDEEHPEKIVLPTSKLIH